MRKYFLLLHSLWHGPWHRLWRHRFHSFADPAAACVSQGSAPQKKAGSLLEVRHSSGCISRVPGCWVRMVLVGNGPCWETSQKHLATQTPLDICALQLSFLLMFGMRILRARLISHKNRESYLAVSCTLVLLIYY